VCEQAAAEMEPEAAAARLHHYMRTLRGAPADGEGTFASFMFHRMMSQGSGGGGVGRCVAEMLQNTPDEFYGELAVGTYG